MHDIIAAISTSLGVGAISIVRVSGEDCISFVNDLFKGCDLTKVNSHTIHYGYIIDQNEIIDEVLVTVMKGPKTFTKEDIVEINCHGGIATTNKILELLLVHGARLAEPGEFTKRAFLNGRIDLVEAEAISDIISAKSESARKLSIGNISGKLTNIIRKFRQELLELLANIEVNIDYPEYEDIEEVTKEELKNKTEKIANSLREIIEESENGRIIQNGIKVAIIGRPNVGKSSILNKLINEEKAIVTDIAGTTRDIVEGSVTLNGILLQFIDTAGIRDTEDIVEKVGVERSIKAMENADLVLFVINQNEEITEEELQLLESIKDKKLIIAMNKNDLPLCSDIEKVKNYPIVYTNTKQDNGIDELKNKIKELFHFDELEKDDFACFSNIRQISLAKEASLILNDVNEGLRNDVPVDLIEIDIKRIWNKLGEILGENYDEELIDQLFSQFCLGK